MVIFKLTGIDIPITLHGGGISYDQQAVDKLAPALQVVFASIMEGIKIDEPGFRQYEPDTSLERYRYIAANNDVELLHHTPPEYVEGRIY